jgi:ferredoxin--NADP+ reductase
MFKIIRKERLAEKITLFEVEAPRVAKAAQPGQFVIIRLNAEGERIPLTIADFDRKNGTITLVVQEVGYTTALMNEFKVGQGIQDVVGPLGHSSHIVKGQHVVVVGGGVGIAPIYPIARGLREAGNKVTAIIGSKNKDLLFWQDKMKAVASELLIATDDGSIGRKGFVTDVLKEVLNKEKVDQVFAIGPGVMMAAVAKIVPENVALTVSLNTLMVDGTGMCGGCRVSVGGETKFTCVDGPEFDGHKVDFPEFLQRHKLYKQEEGHICQIGLKTRK